MNTLIILSAFKGTKNQFDRKADVLESLYNFDKSLTFKK